MTPAKTPTLAQDNEGRVPDVMTATTWTPTNPDIRESQYRPYLSMAQKVFDESVCRDLIAGRIDTNDPHMVSLIQEFIVCFVRYDSSVKVHGQQTSTHRYAQALCQMAMGDRELLPYSIFILADPKK